MTKLFFVIILFVGCRSQHVNFYGVTFNEEVGNYELLKKYPNNFHVDSLAICLQFYGIEFQTNEDTSLIKLSSNELVDMHLLYNITIKSQDTYWWSLQNKNK